MLKKNLYYLVGSIALTVVVFGTYFITTAVIDKLTAPQLIYKNGDMPAFRELQDYTRHKYPGLVRLESDGRFFCSGTVISDDYALTAAHCLIREGLFTPYLMTADIKIISRGFPNQEATFIIARAAAVNTRADYALVKGDFHEFTKIRILFRPNALDAISPAVSLCGFPWGAEGTCYPTSGEYTMFYSQIYTQGKMFPGMSGGPAVDFSTGAVFAVNTGVLKDGGLIISPLIGIFETLGVEVLK